MVFDQQRAQGGITAALCLFFSILSAPAPCVGTRSFLYDFHLPSHFFKPLIHIKACPVFPFLYFILPDETLVWIQKAPFLTADAARTGLFPTFLFNQYFGRAVYSVWRISCALWLPGSPRYSAYSSLIAGFSWDFRIDMLSSSA